MTTVIARQDPLVSIDRPFARAFNGIREFVASAFRAHPDEEFLPVVAYADQAARRVRATRIAVNTVGVTAVVAGAALTPMSTGVAAAQQSISYEQCDDLRTDPDTGVRAKVRIAHERTGRHTAHELEVTATPPFEFDVDYRGTHIHKRIDSGGNVETLRETLGTTTDGDGLPVPTCDEIKAKGVGL